MFLVISSFLKIAYPNLHLNTLQNLYQTQWKIYKSASSNFYGSWLSFPGHEQSRKFVLGTPKILSPAQLLKGFLPRCRTCRCRHCSYITGRSSKVDTLVDFYQKNGGSLLATERGIRFYVPTTQTFFFVHDLGSWARIGRNSSSLTCKFFTGFDNICENPKRDQTPNRTKICDQMLLKYNSTIFFSLQIPSCFSQIRKQMRLGTYL